MNPVDHYVLPVRNKVSVLVYVIFVSNSLTGILKYWEDEKQKEKDEFEKAKSQSETSSSIEISTHNKGSLIQNIQQFDLDFQPPHMIRGLIQKMAGPIGGLDSSSHICELRLESRALCAASCQLMLFICEVRRTKFITKHIFKGSMLRNRICFNLH